MSVRSILHLHLKLLYALKLYLKLHYDLCPWYRWQRGNLTHQIILYHVHLLVCIPANNIKLESVVSYGAGWVLDPCVTLSLSTPVIDLYNKSNARTGGFADPLQRVASLGMAYQVLTPKEIFSAKFSGSSNWTTSRDAVSSTDLPNTPTIEYSKQTFTSDLQLDYQNTRDSIVNYVFKSALKYDLTDSERYKVVSSAEVRLRFLSQFGLINKIDVTYDPFVSLRLIYRVTLSVNVMLGPNF